MTRPISRAAVSLSRLSRLVDTTAFESGRLIRPSYSAVSFGRPIRLIDTTAFESGHLIRPISRAAGLERGRVRAILVFLRVALKFVRVVLVMVRAVLVFTRAVFVLERAVLQPLIWKLDIMKFYWQSTFHIYF